MCRSPVPSFAPNLAKNVKNEEINSFTLANKVWLSQFLWKSGFFDKCLPFYLHCGFWWQPKKSWHLPTDGRSDMDTWFPYTASRSFLHEDRLQSLVIWVMSAKRSKSATSATRRCNFFTISCTWDDVQAALTSLYRWLIVLTGRVFCARLHR